MWDLFAPFVIGFVGSLHCLGMCGPLILAYSLHVKQTEDRNIPSGPSSFQIGFFHHLSFHLGRLLTYGFLGALAAALFYIANLGLLFANLRGVLTLLGGLLMIFLGLVLLRLVPIPDFLATLSTANQTFSRRWVPGFLKSQRFASKLGLGLATGFLPCGLSWAMILKSATTQNVPLGFLTMVAFGLGTVPVLFATGLSASFFTLKMRILGERVAALSVIVMGLILVFKGGRALV